MSNFLTKEELENLGLKAFGDNVLISKNCIIRSPDKVEIGNNVRIDDFVIIGGKLKLHNYIHIAPFTVLHGGDVGIEMLSYSTLSTRCAVYASTDDYSGGAMTNPTVPIEFRNTIEKPVLIKEHVIVGSGTTILQGVTIATGAAIGAMSLVNKNILEWSINYGIPAKRQAPRSKGLLEKCKIFERKWHTIDVGGGYKLINSFRLFLECKRKAA